MKKILVSFVLSLLFIYSFADKVEGTHTQPIVNDTARVIDIEEVVVIASPKETGKLRTLPSSVSLISQKDMQAYHITSLKGASALAPNFYMPDYGSRLTSAIYIRGIGSRINTPAVGMYVDNIPYVDKSAFDFNFYDIERIDILRGPQGTLYGRNTMGGLVKVHSKSPFSYQGTDLRLGYSTKDNHRSVALTHYHRISDQFAFSAGGYYEGGDGFFKNAVTGKKVDGINAGGGRLRAIWLPSDSWKLDFTIGYDYSDEGGYPYIYTGSLTPEENYGQYVGKIANGLENSYRRGLFNTGLNLEHQADNFIFNAVTGFQNLNDRMLMDQDYLPVNIYSLEQKQKQSTLSEEITFKSKPGRQWEWVTGASGFYQWLHTEGPVMFLEDGVQTLIEDNVNDIFAGFHAGNPRAPQMMLDVTSNNLHIENIFDTPTLSAALFHQSTINNFLVEGLSLTAGLRLEYENLKMDYLSNSNIDFNFRIFMQPYMDMTVKDLKANPNFIGKLNKDYWQLLPKFALKYDFDGKNNIYASVAKGYRSGGYNIQMFSDIVQGDMTTKMIDAIFDAPELSAMGSRYKPIIAERVPGYGVVPDVDEITTYKPEYSWNYEVGTHLDLAQGKIRTDLAVFYMDTRDQQLARFSENGFGRMMVNAGKSESYGAEVSFLAAPNRHLNIMANYGYTHSTFKEYEGGQTNAGIVIDYSGNYVPFVPMHTFSAGADYTFFVKGSWIQAVTAGLNYSGAGKIYWTEDNHASDKFNGTLNARLSLQTKNIDIDLWAHNLTDHRFSTFYFESMNRGYKQINKPFQLGVDLRCRF